MLPVVAMLLQNGLNLVANAVLAKGKDYVEKKLGVTLKPDMTPEELAKVQIAQMAHEEELLRLQLEENKLDIDLFKAESQGVTERWKADMGSDSWLSKNIRPLTLIALLAGFFAFAAASAAGYRANESYVTLLGNWGQIVMLAYFGGRTVEKIMESRK